MNERSLRKWNPVLPRPAPCSFSGVHRYTADDMSHRQKIFDDGEGMVSQGDRAQTNYRRSETLQKVFPRKERTHQQTDTMDSNQIILLYVMPPDKRVVKCASHMREKAHVWFLEGGRRQHPLPIRRRNDQARGQGSDKLQKI